MLSFLEPLRIMTAQNVLWVTLLRLSVALFCGGAIGLERGKKRRPAGFRTHMLVCIGAALAMLISQYLSMMETTFWVSLVSPNAPKTDLSRLGAQVINGIGFLGAGTIMVRNHSRVTGLTTAAGLWTTACIGLAIGAGFYWVAILAFVVVLASFTLLFRLERESGIRNVDAYYVELRDVSLVKSFYSRISGQIYEADIVPARSGLPNHVGIELVIRNMKTRDTVLSEFQNSSDVVIAIPQRQ